MRLKGGTPRLLIVVVVSLTTTLASAVFRPDSGVAQVTSQLKAQNGTTTQDIIDNWLRQLSLTPFDVAQEITPYSSLSFAEISNKVNAAYQTACIPRITAGVVAHDFELIMDRPKLSALTVVPDLVSVITNTCRTASNPKPYLDGISLLVARYIQDESEPLSSPPTPQKDRPTSAASTSPVPDFVIDGVCTGAGAAARASKTYERLSEGHGGVLAVGLVAAAFYACPSVLKSIFK